MVVIGITGGTGAGKTTALEVLRGIGAKVIDCDEVYHALLKENTVMKSELCERFGDVLSGDDIDRKKLGKAVFGDPQKLRELNEITHKYVVAEVKALLKEEATSCGFGAAIDAIALFESGLSDLCDYTVAVCAPKETRIERIMAREGISREYACARIDAQNSDEWFKSRCDYVLVNDGEEEEFKEKCIELFSELMPG
jgi:dephospho-CoA kinase